MTRGIARWRYAVAALGWLGLAAVATAADIGQVKIVKGPVTIERAGASLPATVGLRLMTSDIVKTGADASVGITMRDNSLLSAGPNSIVSLDRFEFDATTNRGNFESTLSKGSLSVVSGRIAKESPDAMKVRTPFAVLGVRGTEFVVSAHDPVLATP